MHTKIIILRESILESVVKDVTTFLTFAALIGLGWWIESGAMQWFGGGLAFLFIVARAAMARAKVNYTLKEARELLDRLEDL